MNTLTLGSLFDGSGGFPLAGALNGITLPCAAFVLEGVAEALMGGIKNEDKETDNG